MSKNQPEKNPGPSTVSDDWTKKDSAFLSSVVFL